MSFYKKRQLPDIGEGEKQCKRCEKVKPFSEYRVKATGKVNAFCNRCCDLALKTFHKFNQDGGKKHYRRHNELLRAKRRTVVEHYGNKCACCGESRYEFLAIDHENGGGNAHRRKIGDGGTPLILWLIRNGFPAGFRILCHNCNNAVKIYGVCPHQSINGTHRRNHIG